MIYSRRLLHSAHLRAYIDHIHPFKTREMHMVPAIALAVVSLGLAVWMFRVKRRGLSVACVVAGVCGIGVFLGIIPAIQSVRQAASRSGEL